MQVIPASPINNISPLKDQQVKSCKAYNMNRVEPFCSILNVSHAEAFRDTIEKTKTKNLFRSEADLWSGIQNLQLYEWEIGDLTQGPISKANLCLKKVGKTPQLQQAKR